MEQVEWIVRAVEWTGIAIIVAGSSGSLGVLAFRAFRRGFDEEIYEELRSTLGRSILLGPEFLVVTDIVGAVAIEPTLESLAVLAGIVLIRTFLSFSLQVEIEGRWPWRQRGSGRSKGQ